MGCLFKELDLAKKSIYLLSLLALLIACSPEDLKKTQSNIVESENYIVVYKPTMAMSSLSASSYSASAVVSAKSESISKKYGAKVVKNFSRVISASVMKLSADQVQSLRGDPDVAYIEKDAVVSINAIQEDPVWGLDRIDQQSRALDDQYVYPSGGAEVHAYIIDTGIRISHSEFEGRASHGYDAIDGDFDASDCNGHGTHVAGTVGGKTFGVSKSVKLVGVRVLGCSGGGTISGVIEGVEWVTNNHIKPAVANMSLGGGVSAALDDAIKASIAAGVSYVVAAGNSDKDACSSSPARVSEAITVGATNDDDRRASFSNYGSCVQIFAPGKQIKSASYKGDSKTDTLNGTSMASPHVAGVVALVLAQAPQASPEEVSQAIISNAVDGAISSVGSQSPNKLLNMEFVAVDDGSDGDDSGGDDSTPSGPQEIRVGQIVTGIAVAKDEERHFVFNADAGFENVKVSLSGGDGDADMYVKVGSAPDVGSYDCRPYVSGNEEECLVGEVNQKIYIMVRGYVAASGVSVSISGKAIESVPEESLDDLESPCSSCDVADGEMAGAGSYAYHPDGTYYYSRRSTRHRVYVMAIGNIDIDVELYKWNGRQFKIVDSSSRAGSSESISYFGSSGYYLIRVYSKSGSGKYRIWSRH